MNPPHGSVGIVQSPLYYEASIPLFARSAPEVKSRSAYRKDLNDPHTAVWGIRGPSLIWKLRD
jgi:hypothetical protein